MKNKGVIISTLLAILAGAGLVAIFVQNASQYMTIAEAKQTQSKDLHVAGDMIKETQQNDMLHNEIRFTIKDAGGTLPVIYKGPQPGNLGEATKVVVCGHMDGNVFKANNILVKCPSKYESTKTPDPKSS